MIRTSRLTWLVLSVAIAATTPALADTFYGYSQGGIPGGSDIFTWCDTPPCDVAQPDICGTPEGGASLRMNTNVWGGFGVFLDAAGGTLQDLSAFQTGDLRFFAKVPRPDAGVNFKVEIQCVPDPVGNPGGDTYTRFLTDYGWNGNSTWQEFVIPIADFFSPSPVDVACLQTVKAPYMGTIENLPFFDTFWIDYVRWETANSNPGASSVQVSGRELLVGGEPFVVNGFDYAPISIGENWQAGWQDRPDRYLVDFPLMADAGANTVRLYAPVTSKAMLDAAWAEGLYVIPTFGVDGIQLTCADGRTAMQDRFVEYVNQWKDHPAILFWLVGNEVNVNLGGADLCLDWYPQLDAMAAAAHAAEGPGFHPVGTASADVADVCIAGCSDDTALPNVDLWGAQIYRGCTFGSAFSEYSAKADCDRPLVVTEFGADAWDSLLGPMGSESQTMQANCMQTLLNDADQELAVRTPGGVSAGQVVFEWADEWWKAECSPSTEWTEHDTCTSFTNSNYPDPAQNEEWWGVASHETFCSTTTTTPCVSNADCPGAETCSFVPDPSARILRTASTNVSDSWNLGAVCNLEVASFDPGTGSTTLTFDPAAGSSDHTLYHGPLSSVSSYGYTAAVTGLGATGSSTVTLPGGSLFWVVVGRNNGAEGCYGTDFPGGIERPPFSGALVPQAANRNCVCP